MPMITKRPRTERQREWLEHVQACRARGLSLKAYAEQAGLDAQRLYQWHHRFKRLGFIPGTKTVSFAPVELPACAERVGTQSLHFPSGLVLEWAGGADVALVARLLELSEPPR